MAQEDDLGGSVGRRGRICVPTLAGLGVVHAAALAGVVHAVKAPSTATLVLAVVFYVMCGLSITAGYHRLFAHRAYRATPPARWIFLVFGAGSLQNSAIAWSADHRAHHAHTDQPGDPHSILKGFSYAHISWLFRRRDASADVTRLDDLWDLRSIRLQHRYYTVLAVGAGLLLPALIASSWGDFWGGLLVAGFLRVAVVLQATFCINSLAHTVGSRNYDASASARDSTLTALVTFGEGYHNFHHRFPFDYRNGIRWWHYDPSKWLIWGLDRVGLASKLRRAATARITRALSRV